MAVQLGVSTASASLHWRTHGLKPHQVCGFKLSRDPSFAENLDDIVGLYMLPPQHALMLCCDEKRQVQALDRSQPGLPLKKEGMTTMTQGCKHYGTMTLFAALNVLDGRVIAQCQPQLRHIEWLKFLRKIDKRHRSRRSCICFATATRPTNILPCKRG